MRRLLAAVSLTLAVSTAVEAQFFTDAGSPLGGGGGASGSVANYMRAGGMNAARANFLAALQNASGAMTATNPATGQPVAVPPATAAAIVAILNGTGGAGPLATALGGSAQAGTAAQTFASFVQNPTPATLVGAIVAYNNLVDATEPGNPSVLGLRAAIVALGMF